MKTPFLALLLSVVSFTVTAQTPDDDIVMAERIERYEFAKGDKDNPVHVKQHFFTRYRCDATRGVVPYVEFYNEQSRVDAAEVHVSGKKLKGLKVRDEYYSVDDIFFSDARVYFFEVPLEKKGSETAVELKKTILDPKYFTTVYFPESLPVEMKKVEIVVPAWMKLEIRERNMEGVTIEKSVQPGTGKNTGAQVHTYTLKNIPAQKKQPGMPGPSHVYPHLMLLTQEAAVETGTVKYFATLPDQYKWYHSLVKGLTISTPAIEAKAREITNGATDPVEKMKRVLHWVQDNIRYIAFENGIAGFRPMEAEQVLQKKYGDCKGMANLTRSLLKASGVDARLCWIGTNHLAYDYSTPSLCVDNHMICAVKSEGKTFFLDGTESFIGWEEYAQRIQGRQVLIEDGEGFLLEKVPERDFTQNTKSEVSEIVINGTDFKGNTKFTWRGESKSGLLSALHSFSKEEQEKMLVDYFRENRKGFVLSGLKKPSLDNWSGNLDGGYTFEWKEAASSFGKEIYFEPDFRKEFASASIDTTKRTADYEFPYKYNIEQQTFFSFPEGYTLKSTPKAFSVQRPGYAITITAMAEKGGLLYKKKISLSQTRLPLKNIVQWNEDISALKKYYNEQVILTRS
ncbi:transglutaminase domain-containing protein [Parasegetibacter sp. NRK P23]|uniref:transglutaminase domain-containing protein n=1 Tax=Parasegetibacter sp. NRK P23 TaxID=2942999 RepID=UPI00204318CF|nr:transglutaminase domain-containing protein [Parasegetibacter sp. NRK P23]MCM5530558.1 DUF3857 domain-containing protein [Parasegetibacter sp. NRK P23]